MITLQLIATISLYIVVIGMAIPIVLVGIYALGATLFGLMIIVMCLILKVCEMVIKPFKMIKWRTKEQKDLDRFFTTFNKGMNVKKDKKEGDL